MGPEERRRGPTWSPHGPLTPVIVFARDRDQGQNGTGRQWSHIQTPSFLLHTHLSSRLGLRKTLPFSSPAWEQSLPASPGIPIPRDLQSPGTRLSRETPSPQSPVPVPNRKLHQRPRPHRAAPAPHRPRLPRPSPALTKQMPAARRGTSVHTVCSRHRKVTTVTFSSCSTRGVGARVPRRPQPMARHWVPWDSDWPCWGREASATFSPKEAGRFSCRKEDVRPLPHPP